MNRAVVRIEVLMVMALFGFNSASLAAEWESTVAAAKKEGKVSVISDVTSTMRDALTLDFEKKYGISVDLFGTSGREVAPRVAAERKAGQFLWDIYIHGSTTALEAMIPMGAFDPLEPALIQPDVKDPKTWRGGGMEFLDPGKMVFRRCDFYFLLSSPGTWPGFHSRAREAADDDPAGLRTGGGCRGSREISGAYRCRGLCRDH